MKRRDISFLCLIVIWLYFIIHFGWGQIKVTSPHWEHYVIEGYFLFSLSIMTYLLVSLIKLQTIGETPT